MSPSQALLTLLKLCDPRPSPFRTFVVRTQDRQEFEVEDPLRVALPENPSAGTFVVYTGQVLHIIGLDSITSIEVAR